MGLTDKLCHLLWMTTVIFVWKIGETYITDIGGISVRGAKVERKDQDGVMVDADTKVEITTSEDDPSLNDDLISADSMDTKYHAYNTTGKLFLCGYKSGAVARGIFPDYAANGMSPKYKGNGISHATKKDILVWGIHQPCKHGFEFPGKVLMLNVERFFDKPAEKFQMDGRKRGEDLWIGGGVSEDLEKHHILLYYMVFGPFMQLYNTMGQTLIKEFIDIRFKPKNNKKYNGVTYINRMCKSHREQAIGEIAKILPVYIGGRCQGKRDKTNPGTFLEMILPKESDRNHFFNNAKIYKDYKFCFCMENTDSSIPGYMTEKILFAFRGGCIPIYWGAPENVHNIFNKDAFVYYDPHNPAPALELLEELHMNETRYDEMLDQPILADGENTLRKFFSLHDNIGGGHLKNHIRKVMGV